MYKSNLVFIQKPFIVDTTYYVIMKKKYKAIITDVDGTLIPNRKDGKISPKVHAAIQQAKKKLHVGLATSRDPEDVQDFTSQLELSGPSILYGGSWIVDAQSYDVLWEKNIERQAFDEAYKIAKELGFYFVVNDNGRKYKPDEAYAPIQPINIWGHGLEYHQMEMFIKNTHHINSFCVHTVPSWKEGKIDFIANNPLGTKEHAIAEVAKLLKIQPDEIIGIGDGANDMPLLAACGLKIAVGNAVDELKAVADYIAPTVEQDALADIIEKFVV